MPSAESGTAKKISSGVEDDMPRRLHTCVMSASAAYVLPLARGSVQLSVEAPVSQGMTLLSVHRLLDKQASVHSGDTKADA